MLLDQRYPPKIAYGTWIDDPRNAEWAWAKPALLEEAAKLAGPQSQGNSLGDLLDIQLKLKELNGDKDPGMAAILVQLLSNQDPAKQVEMTKTLMEMAEGKRAPADTGMTLVVEVLREQLRSVQEDLRSLRSQGPPDPFSGVKPVLELLTNLGVNIGGNQAPAKSNPGDTIVSTLGDIASKVVDKIADYTPIIVDAYKFGKDRDYQIAVHGQQPQRPNARPWAYDPNAPQPMPVTQTTQAQPVPVTQTAPLPPPADQPMNPQTLYLKYKPLIESIFPFLQDHFKRTNGDEFREWFIESKGTDLWAAFKKDATPELLSQLVSMTPPHIKEVFSPAEAVHVFFSDMLDEEGAEARDQDPDEGEQTDV